MRVSVCDCMMCAQAQDVPLSRKRSRKPTKPQIHEHTNTNQSNTRPLCRPWSDYLPALAQMRDRYGADTVFVSTDDEEVARIAPR